MSGAPTVGPWTEFQGAGNGPSAAPAPPAAGPWTRFQGNSGAMAPSADASGAQPSAPPETAGRVAGLGLRALWTGAAGMVGTTDGLIERGVDAVPHVLSDVEHGDFREAGQDAKEAIEGPPSKPYDGPQLSDFVHPSRWQQAAEYFANKAGLPAPATPGERIASAAVGALPALAMTPEDPEAAAGDIGLLGRAWEAAKVAAPVMASGATAQLVKEDGGTPAEQLLAGLGVGAGIPLAGSGAAAALRGLVRGGPEKGAAMRTVLDSFHDEGLEPTAAQASGRRWVGHVEKTVSRLPGGGPLEAAGEAQRRSLGNTVDEIVQNLTGQTHITPTSTGEAIERGLKGAAKQMKADASAAYDKVDSLVHPDTPVAPLMFEAALDKLTHVPPGAENLAEQLISPKVKALRAAFYNDVGVPPEAVPAESAAPASTGAPGYDVATIGTHEGPKFVITQNREPYIPQGADRPQWFDSEEEAAGAIPNGPASSAPESVASEAAAEPFPAAAQTRTLPYATLRALKSQLGNSINWSPFATDTDNGSLKLLWKALRVDMNNAAANTSPEAQRAVDDANALYSVNMKKQRILERVLRRQGGPEAIYNSLYRSTKEGPTKIRAVLNAVDQPTRDLIAGAVIRRMGLANPNAQDLAGDVFNPDTFLTRWNQMNPEARDALFSTIPGKYKNAVNALAKNIERIKNTSHVLDNASGTGKAWAHNAWLAELVSSVPMALFAPHFAAEQLVAGLGVGGGNWALAKALTSPAAVRWLATNTTLPRSLAPVLAAQATRSKPQP